MRVSFLEFNSIVLLVIDDILVDMWVCLRCVSVWIYLKKCSIVYLCKQRAMPKIVGTIKLVCKCKNYTCKSKSRCFFRRFVSPHRSRLIFGLSVFVTPLPRNSQILSRWERKQRILPLRSPPPPSPRRRRGRSPLAQRSSSPGSSARSSLPPFTPNCKFRLLIVPSI